MMFRLNSMLMILVLAMSQSIVASEQIETGEIRNLQKGDRFI